MMLSSTSSPTLIFPVEDPKADPPHGKCSHLSPRASKFSKLLAPRKLGPGPTFGVDRQGFPHLTCSPARSRVPSGPIGSNGVGVFESRGQAGWVDGSASSPRAQPAGSTAFPTKSPAAPDVLNELFDG